MVRISLDGFRRFVRLHFFGLAKNLSTAPRWRGRITGVLAEPPPAVEPTRAPDLLLPPLSFLGSPGLRPMTMLFFSSARAPGGRLSSLNFTPSSVERGPQFIS